MSSRLGIIDLGTNTFHLLIVEKNAESFNSIFHESRPARIGLGGINKRIITPEAIIRAMDVLTYFREKLDAFEVAPENTFRIRNKCHSKCR